LLTKLDARLSHSTWQAPLARELAVRTGSSLEITCRELADELTSLWSAQRLDTHLSIFLAGYEDSEARFWYVCNGGFPSGELQFPRTFEAVNDLDEVWFPRTAQAGETKDHLVARAHPSFRRGVLSAALIFDSFTKVVEETFVAGHREFQPLDSLDRFAAYARFRFEFTKRMYDPKYGLGVNPRPPVRGDIHVFSVEPTGVRKAHGKHVRQARVLP